MSQRPNPCCTALCCLSKHQIQPSLSSRPFHPILGICSISCLACTTCEPGSVDECALCSRRLSIFSLFPMHFLLLHSRAPRHILPMIVFYSPHPSIPALIMSRMACNPRNNTLSRVSTVHQLCAYSDCDAIPCQRAQILYDEYFLPLFLLSTVFFTSLLCVLWLPLYLSLPQSIRPSSLLCFVMLFVLVYYSFLLPWTYTWFLLLVPTSMLNMSLHTVATVNTVLYWLCKIRCSHLWISFLEHRAHLSIVPRSLSIVLSRPVLLTVVATVLRFGVIPKNLGWHSLHPILPPLICKLIPCWGWLDITWQCDSVKAKGYELPALPRKGPLWAMLSSILKSLDSTGSCCLFHIWGPFLVILEAT